MKAFFATLMVGIALLLPSALQAADSFGTANTFSPSQYTHAPLMTNTSAFLLNAGVTTNIPVTMANLMPVPRDGYGIYFRHGNTNANDTNFVAILEGVIFTSSGVTQVVDNATITLTPLGAVGIDTLYNFPGAQTANGATNILSRCDAIRLRSLQNTNANTMWVSNSFQIR